MTISSDLLSKNAVCIFPFLEELDIFIVMTNTAASNKDPIIRKKIFL
jgi:hypothetical protein